MKCGESLMLDIYFLTIGKEFINNDLHYMSYVEDFKLRFRLV
jgi:hypothetical protein